MFTQTYLTIVHFTVMFTQTYFAIVHYNVIFIQTYLTIVHFTVVFNFYFISSFFWIESDFSNALVCVKIKLATTFHPQWKLGEGKTSTRHPKEKKNAPQIEDNDKMKQLFDFCILHNGEKKLCNVIKIKIDWIIFFSFS